MIVLNGSAVVKIYYKDTMYLDMCNNTIVSYLKESDLDKCCEILSEYIKNEYNDGIYYDYQESIVEWKDVDTSYRVLLSDNVDFSRELIFDTVSNSIKFGCLIPGKRYYFRVYDSKNNVVEQGCFKTNDAPVRFVNIEGVSNARDFGGWTTQDGKKINYGLLYRGAELEGKHGSVATQNGIAFMKDVLGIKTEIDLRNDSEINEAKEGAIDNPLSQYFRVKLLYYSLIIPENATDKFYYGACYVESTKSELQLLFSLLSKKENYPMYFHCVWGADRTGTVAFIINGLLGVSYEDLAKEYSLTTFSRCGLRGVSSPKRSWKEVSREQLTDYSDLYRFYWQIMSYYHTSDETLSSAIENYLVNTMDIRQETIDTVKKILLSD